MSDGADITRGILVSKQKAAASHIDAAIEHYFSGNIEVSITLAGAAEESVPDQKNGQNFVLSFAKKKGASRFGSSEREIVSKLNSTRDWLKHAKSEEAEKYIAPVEGVFMILRAYSKFTACYGLNSPTGKMLEFERWVRENCPEIVGPEGSQ